MTPQPSPSSTTQARNGRRSGTALRSGTRAARGGCVRRRAFVAALGLAVLAAIVPVTAAHADQPPHLPDFPYGTLDDLINSTDNHDQSQLPGLPDDFSGPTDHPGPLLAPDLPDFPDDLANPTENPEPPVPPDNGPDDVANPTENPEPPDNGPDDLVNPTQNPEPPTPPVDNPTPSVDHSIPTPHRIDAGFGGAAAGSHQLAGVALIAAAVLLALLVAAIARRQRAETGSTR